MVGLTTVDLKEKVGPFPAYVYPVGGLVLVVGAFLWRRAKGNASTSTSTGASTAATGDTGTGTSPYSAGDYYWPSTYYVPPGTATGTTPTPVGYTPPVFRGGTSPGISGLGTLLHATPIPASYVTTPVTGHLPVDTLPILRPQGLAAGNVGTVPASGVQPAVNLSTLQAQARRQAA